MNFFGRNLRYLREKRALTQKQMMPLLGITDTTWSNYENGVSEPSIEVLINISNFFGVTMDELITGDIPAQDGYTARQRKHKPYVVNNASARLMEQRSELYQLTKELKKLRKDVDAIKKTQR